MDDILEEIGDKAFASLEKVGGDPALLPKSLRTVVVVISAQGVIDNGGFKYFFEENFDNNPSYSFIADAYREIGARTAARSIEKAASVFPFENPHLYQEERWNFLNNESNPDSVNIQKIGNKVCGDDSIWEKLEKYVLRNREKLEKLFREF